MAKNSTKKQHAPNIAPVDLDPQAKAQLNSIRLYTAAKWGAASLAVTGLVALIGLPFVAAGLLTLTFVPTLVLTLSAFALVLSSAVLSFFEKPAKDALTVKQAAHEHTKKQLLQQATDNASLRTELTAANQKIQEQEFLLTTSVQQINQTHHDLETTQAKLLEVCTAATQDKTMLERKLSNVEQQSSLMASQLEAMHSELAQKTQALEAKTAELALLRLAPSESQGHQKAAESTVLFVATEAQIQAQESLEQTTNELADAKALLATQTTALQAANHRITELQAALHSKNPLHDSVSQPSEQRGAAAVPLLPPALTRRNAPIPARELNLSNAPVVLDFDRTLFPKHLHNTLMAEFFRHKNARKYHCPQFCQFADEAQAEAWLQTNEGYKWLTNKVLPGETADQKTQAYLADAKTFYEQLIAQGREAYIASHTSFRTPLMLVLERAGIKIAPDKVHVYGQIVAQHRQEHTQPPDRSEGKAMYLNPLGVNGRPTYLVDDSATNIAKWPSKAMALKFAPTSATRPFNCVREKLNLELLPEVGAAAGDVLDRQNPAILIAPALQQPSEQELQPAKEDKQPTHPATHTMQ